MFEAPSTPSLNLTDPSKGYAGYDVKGYPISTPQSSMPASMLYASMGLSLIGTVSSIWGQVAATRAQGDYEQSIARMNATIARVQARQVREAGDVVAARKNIETRQTVGSIRAVQGASGVDVSSGSSMLVRNSVAGVGAIDELTIRNNAARQAWGYETESMEDTFKGQFSQLTAKAKADQSLLTGGLQAVSGPLGIYTKYKSYGGTDSSRRLPFDLKTG